jgi:hypothetical protein
MSFRPTGEILDEIHANFAGEGRAANADIRFVGHKTNKGER